MSKIDKSSIFNGAVLMNSQTILWIDTRMVRMQKKRNKAEGMFKLELKE